MGPLISDEQFEKVLGYLESGKEAGAEAVVGGGRSASAATSCSRPSSPTPPAT